ncbi:MAG: class I tRNA ligase family protein, partial [Caldilineaceae bacterium SB0665_bin_25]|nr:class I tRNA ligase family protein [Caldilineaceae bacterium SB0665_bin_25]
HQTIAKVSEDFGSFRFNTAIAALMEFNNYLIRVKDTFTGPQSGETEDGIWRESVRNLLLMMAPVFPHVSEELWQRLADGGDAASVHLQAWPQADPEKAEEEEITVVVQVNGRVRDKLSVPPNTAEEELESMALASNNVQRWMDGKQVRKVVVVADKLVNIVIG